MYRITLISPFFGKKFPANFPVLLNSLQNNSKIKFVILTDVNFSSIDNISNVQFVKTNLPALKHKIDLMLGYQSRLVNPYKLVDFKPTYGVLFNEYIKDSEWWGYFDMDIVFGNISNFLTEDILNSYDRYSLMDISLYTGIINSSIIYGITTIASLKFQVFTLLQHIKQSSPLMNGVGVKIRAVVYLML